jgi:hypothetical protein
MNQTSMLQTYLLNKQKDNDKTKVEDFRSRQEKSHAIAKESVLKIYSYFGVEDKYNESFMEQFPPLYNYETYSIQLNDFPFDFFIEKYFPVLKKLDYLKFKEKRDLCLEIDNLSLKNIKFSFSFGKRFGNTEFVVSSRVINFILNEKFELIEIFINDIESTVWNKKNKQLIKKQKEIISSIEEESLLIELYINDFGHSFEDIFPEFYIPGTYILNETEIKQKMSFLQMLNY